MLKFVRQLAIVFSLAVFGGGLASTALASPTHDHNSHQMMTSPFHVKPKGERLHCLLHGHNLKKPCPHHLLEKGPKNKLQHAIASDCGGNPFQKQSAIASFSTVFLVNSTFDFHIFFESEGIDFQSSVYLLRPLVPFPPPPRFL